MSDSTQPISSGADSSGDKPAARDGTRRRGRRGGRGRRKTFPARPGEDAPGAETQDPSASDPTPVETADAPTTTAIGAGVTQPASQPAAAERTERPQRPERPASEPLPPRRPPIPPRPHAPPHQPRRQDCECEQIERVQNQRHGSGSEGSAITRPPQRSQCLLARTVPEKSGG